MSFILDALKKSESDRQRQTGPALFEVKITPPKARFPPWAIAIAALLGVNVVIVGWLLFRHPSRTDEAGVGAAAAPVDALHAAALQQQHAQQQTKSVAAQDSMATQTTPSPTPASSSAAAASSTAPDLAADAQLTAPQAAGAPQSNVQQGSSPSAGAAGANSRPWGSPLPMGTDNVDLDTPTLSGAAKDVTDSKVANPDDYAPAADPPPNPLFKGHVSRGTESGYRLYQDAALAPGAKLPQLRLDLHVYAAKPQDRFALINMKKMREGDSTPEGVRVESITPDGVVMSKDGAKFLLPNE